MNKAAYQYIFQNDALYSLRDTLALDEIESVNLPQTESTPPPPVVSQAPASQTKPPVAKPAEPLPQLNHKVLVLVDDIDYQPLSPSDALFLNRILQAVHLNTDGVDILNVGGAKRMDFRPLLAGKQIHHFISFGVPFLSLGLEILMDRYQPKNIAGINFLLAESLAVIQEDVTHKKRLWASLQQMFLNNNTQQR